LLHIRENQKDMKKKERKIGRIRKKTEREKKIKKYQILHLAYPVCISYF
jgi:hypothetical protein